MKLEIQRSRDLFHHLIVLIFVFLFIFTIGDIMYWQTSRATMWRTVYSVSLYAVFALDIIFIIFHIWCRRKITAFCLMVFGYLVYETIVSIATSIYGLQSFIQDGYTWPLTFIVFYLYTLYAGKDMVIRALKKTLFVGSVVCMVLLINNIRIHLSSTLDGLQGGVISPVYFCLSLLGLILLMGNSREKIVFSILIAIMIIVSSKRTGFVIIFVGLIAYFWVEARMENRLTNRIRRYGRYLLIAALVIIIGIWAINQFDLQIITRLLNSTDDGGSGRLLIWDSVLSNFGQSSGIEQLFGHGFHAVPDIVRPLGRELYAHNSFLEVLFDFGLIGLIWLIGIIISLVVRTIAMMRKKCQYAPVLIYSLVEILLLALLSYFFEDSTFILFVAVLWGICLGDYRKQEFRKRESLNTLPNLSMKPQIQFSEGTQRNLSGTSN